MNLVDLANDPRAQVVIGLLVASASSTVHTFLDKHPRTQAFFRLASHALGPLNLPAMRKAGVELARAIVSYEDKSAGTPHEKLEDLKKEIAAARATDGVKAWPQS